MRQPLLLITSLLAVQATAQTFDLNSLISQGYSFFTSVTASLASSASRASASAASASATASQDLFTTDGVTTTGVSATPSSTSLPSAVPSTLRTSTTGQQTGTITSASALPTTSSRASITSQATTSQSGSNTSNTGQSSSATAGANSSVDQSNSGSNHDRTLAIVLGTVLGALALGLLLLLIIILLKRRKRRRGMAAGNASLTSNSSDSIAAYGAGGPHKKSRKGMFSRHSRQGYPSNINAGPPLMSQRAQYDVPSPHVFKDSNSSPYMPAAAAGKTSSGLLPTRTADSYGNPLPHQSGGLSSHPYHDNHHAGAGVAAAAGGAALGAAAAKRHSRSHERRRDSSLVHEPPTHPEYFDEPPPRSPARTSVDSRRRSGSMARGTFVGPTDHANSPLRNGMSTAAVGGVAGAATGAMVGRSGRRSLERGRTPPTDHMSSGMIPNHTGPHAQQYPTNDPAYSNYHSASAAPMSHSPIGASTHSGVNGGHTHSTGVAATGLAANMARSHHTGSGSPNHPTLPPALMIPDPNRRRSLPSRSPKRTRFSDGNTYHEAMPIRDERTSVGISPATTGKTNSWSSQFNPSMAGTTTDDIVSPVSPDYSTSARHSIGREVPIQPGRANMINHPRSRSVSPARQGLGPRSGHTPPLKNFPTPPTTTRTSRHSQNGQPMPTNQKRHSGLVNAVQGHFDPTSGSDTTGTSHSSPQPPAYQAYSPQQVGLSRGPDLLDPNRQPRPVARKPVPLSRYAKSSSQTPEYDDQVSQDQALWRRQQAEEGLGWAR